VRRSFYLLYVDEPGGDSSFPSAIEKQKNRWEISKKKKETRKLGPEDQKTVLRWGGGGGYGVTGEIMVSRERGVNDLGVRRNIDILAEGAGFGRTRGALGSKERAGPRTQKRVRKGATWSRTAEGRGSRELTVPE